jgi:hypothetical protein
MFIYLLLYNAKVILNFSEPIQWCGRAEIQIMEGCVSQLSITEKKCLKEPTLQDEMFILVHRFRGWSLSPDTFGLWQHSKWQQKRAAEEATFLIIVRKQRGDEMT